MHSRLHIEIMTRLRSRWATCRPLLAHRAESAHQRHDKVQRFEALGINRRNFPYRLYGPEGRPKVPRYFAFKLPISVDDQAATFVYVDAAQRPQCSSSDSTQRSATAMDTSTAHGPNTETHDGSSMFAMETPSFTLVRPLSTRLASAQTTAPAM